VAVTPVQTDPTSPSGTSAPSSGDPTTSGPSSTGTGSQSQPTVVIGAVHPGKGPKKHHGSKLFNHAPSAQHQLGAAKVHVQAQSGSHTKPK
jgi:hypothetical protein